MQIRTDLIRGAAACRRAESQDLNDSGRALRAKAELLRRRFLQLEARSAALRDRAQRLREQLERER